MDKEELARLIKKLSDSKQGERWGIAWDLGIAADGGVDITAAIPALIGALSDEVRTRRNIVWALENTAMKGRDITPAIPALIIALSDEDETVRRHAANALGWTMWNGLEIASAIPALMGALSDEDRHVRLNAAQALGRGVAKGLIELEKVTESLKRCVAKVRETHDEALISRTKLECAGLYILVVYIIDKSKQKIGMDGELLTEKPKPPKPQGGMYRMGRTVAW